MPINIRCFSLFRMLKRTNAGLQQYYMNSNWRRRISFRYWDSLTVSCQLVRSRYRLSASVFPRYETQSVPYNLWVLRWGWKFSCWYSNLSHLFQTLGLSEPVAAYLHAYLRDIFQGGTFSFQPDTRLGSIFSSLKCSCGTLTNFLEITREFCLPVASMYHAHMTVIS
jgi:hypothetical protein